MMNLAEFISYDPNTGILRWKKKSSALARNKIGEQIGTVNGSGYLVFKFKGQQYYAQRVAWFLMTGQWPENIDHINRARSDNRWCNLREASCSQNAINRTMPAGITFDKRSQKFEARIQKLGRRKRLGYFDSFKEARVARLNAERKLFGEFARSG